MELAIKSLLQTFLYLQAIIFTYECLIEEDSFKYSGANVHIDAQYNHLLTKISNIPSREDCAIYVAKRFKFMWFVHNKQKRTCVTSECWSIPVQQTLSSSNVYYKRKGNVIQTCSDVKKVDSMAADGEYWIFPDAPTFMGCRTRIYCHDMGTASPKEFVSLSVANTGVFPHLGNPWCTGESPSLLPEIADGRPGTWHFLKIRVNIKTMAVVVEDRTFTHSSGGEIIYYGTAADCYAESDKPCGPVGTFSINTHGTGTVIDKNLKWAGYGYEPYVPSVTRSADGVRIDLLCGGWCGHCSPVGPIVLHKNLNEELARESAVFVKEKSCCL